MADTISSTLYYLSTIRIGIEVKVRPALPLLTIHPAARPIDSEPIIRDATWPVPSNISTGLPRGPVTGKYTPHAAASPLRAQSADVSANLVHVLLSLPRTSATGLPPNHT
jgi:hypothetical protein